MKVEHCPGKEDQELFDYLADELGATATQSQIADIKQIVERQR